MDWVFATERLRRFENSLCTDLKHHSYGAQKVLSGSGCLKVSKSEAGGTIWQLVPYADMLVPYACINKHETILCLLQSCNARK